MLRHDLAFAGVLTCLVLSELLSAAAPPRHVIENLNKLPLAFERNQGQVQPKVDYLARGKGYSVYLSHGNARIALRRPKVSHAPVLDLQLIGARLAPAATSRQLLPGKVNYFLGNDPSRWRVDIPTFARVEYRNVYPGIDLAYYGNQGRLEYDFIVAPTADPGGVRIAIAGARKMGVDAAGNLVLEMEDGEVQFHKPETYQEIAGVRKTVESRYLLDGANEVRFSLGPYDRGEALVIDPALVYSTYLGGTDLATGEGYGQDYGVAIAVGPQGNAFVTGFTASLDFPTVNPEQSFFTDEGSAMFVSELTTDGSGLIYSTYLGGSTADFSSSIAVDSDGNAIVVGQADSPGFPVKNALYPTLNDGFHGFVTKLSPAGDALVYSTYLGGSGTDYAKGVAVDSDHNVYVAGTTASPDFPVTPGAYQTTPSGNFVTKLDHSGSALVWSTYFGNGAYARIAAIAVGSTGAVYLTGSAELYLPVTPGAPQPVFGGGSSDAFFASLNKTGTALSYCTYLGGSGEDYGTSIAVDSGGGAYVTGQTTSTDLPVTPSAFQLSLPGGADAFVAKLDSLGTEFKYVTYLGGQHYDLANGIAVDSSGNAIVVGYTTSSAFPLKAALQPAFPGNGTALFKTTSSGAAWRASDTTIGAIVDAIAIDPGSPNILVAGALGDGYGTWQSSDGGAHWTGTANPYSSYAFPPTAVAFLPAGANAGDIAYAGSVEIFLASSDNGLGFSTSSTPVTISTIAVDPTTSTTVYIGGSEICEVTCYPGGAAKSTDGGTTWVTLTGLGATSAFAIDPASPNTVYAASGGLLFKSTDGGQTWAGLNIAAGSVVLDLSRPSVIYIAAGATVYKSTDAGSSWTPAAAGLTASVNGLALALSSPSVLYAATNAGVFLTSNGGASWAPAGLTQYNITSVAVDPRNPAVAYAVNSNVGGQTGFVAKINPLGTGLIYSTYLGGTGITSANGVATNSSGDAFVTGQISDSPDFPTTSGSFQSATGVSRNSAFVARITETTPSCTYTVSPDSYLFYPAGGSLNLSVVSPSGCAWAPTPSDSWITVASGTGPGVAALTISVAANPGAARSGSITAGTSAVAIAQAAMGCTYAVSSSSPKVFPQAGGTASIDVVTQPGCGWNVTDVMLWLSVTSGASGSGNGTVSIQAAPNPFPDNRNVNYQTSLVVAGQEVDFDQYGTSGNREGRTGPFALAPR